MTKAWTYALAAASVAMPAAAFAAGRCPLRIAIVVGNAAQASRSADGTYRGIAIDVARDLAHQWQRDLTVTAMAPAAIIAALEERVIDLGFAAANPRRGGAVVYSAPYMLVQQTAMVRDDSSLRSVAALDANGARIGANTGDSIAMYLTRTLTRATLLTSPDIALGEAVRWVRDGTVVAFAGNRQRLGAVAGQVGLRLLPDNLTAVPQAIAVRADDHAMIAAVSGALRQLQSSGRVAAIIRAGGIDGVISAPVADGRAGSNEAPPCPTGPVPGRAQSGGDDGH